MASLVVWVFGGEPQGVVLVPRAHGIVQSP